MRRVCGILVLALGLVAVGCGGLPNLLLIASNAAQGRPICRDPDVRKDASRLLELTVRCAQSGRWLMAGGVALTLFGIYLARREPGRQSGGNKGEQSV